MQAEVFQGLQRKAHYIIKVHAEYLLLHSDCLKIGYLYTVVNLQCLTGKPSVNPAFAK